MGVLKIGKDGMASLELVPKGMLLRFLGNAGLGDVSLMENIVFSLPDREMEISGVQDNSVSVSKLCSVTNSYKRFF